MNEKKYLKWYNKVGYGSGDLAANCIYVFLTNFVMIYLTDTIGLSAAVIGTLIMFSKFADGITDVFFGMLIDKTKSKMGKARPWMFWAMFGNAIMLVILYSMPATLGKTAQYVYFFIVYTALNAVFFTANNIAYSSLTSLITRNGNERVQMGSIRFMFALVTNITISSLTIKLVGNFGGGTDGWRTVAIIYGVIACIVNAISVFSVKELPKEEGIAVSGEQKDEKISFGDSIKLLLANKYFLLIAGFYTLTYVRIGINSVGIYYTTYVLENPALLGTFTMFQMLPMVIGLAFTPALVKKCKGMYKVNLGGYTMAFVFQICFAVAGCFRNIPIMLLFLALTGICTSPLTGSVNALISAASEYTVRTKGKHIEGTMFSCSSLGVKVGGGIGSALTGILLEVSGYVANATQQPASTMNMLNFMYLWLPAIVIGLIAVIQYFLRVEKANAEWDAAHGVK